MPPTPGSHVVSVDYDDSPETPALLLDRERHLILLPQTNGPSLEVPVYDFAAAAIAVKEHLPCLRCKIGTIDCLDPTQVPIRVLCGTCGAVHVVLHDETVPEIKPELHLLA
jgi:hypothetical protein